MPTKETLIRFLERNETLCREAVELHQFPENAELNIKESVFLSDLIERAKQATNSNEVDVVVKELKNSYCLTNNM